MKKRKRFVEWFSLKSEGIKVLLFFSRMESHYVIFYVMRGRAGWVGPNEFDYTMPDRCIEELLSLNPEVLFLPRIQFKGSNNDWWCKNHPEELVRLSNGEVESAHSTASEIWRQEAAKHL